MRSMLWVHALLRISLCFLYPLAISCSFSLYKSLGGVILSRGVSAGMATQLVVIVFAVINFSLMAVFSLKARLATMMVFSVAVLLWLYSYHPLRALMFVGLTVVLMLSAEWILSLLSRVLVEKRS